MKKSILKLSLIFAIFIGIITICNISNANSISSIDMDIYVDKDGNATVTEIWDCSVNQGTESYHPYYNLGKSEISNLTVYDETQSYTTLDRWKVDASLNEKAYKCGINKISNGVELCWGISKYGKHKYVVKYNISNFVSELTDSQMAYWTLIPYDFSTAIGSVTIKIHTDAYLPDTIDVWGYGNYGGLCYVADGAIHMKSDGRLDSNEYMTILAKFPKGTFNATNNLEKDFDYYFKMAEEGSTKYNKKKADTLNSVFVILKAMSPFIIMVVLGIIVGKNTNNKYGFKYGSYGKSMPKDLAYYRDIPCNGDIFRAYYIAYQYGLVKKKTDVLGAIILKWLKQGKIRTEDKEGGKVFKKENTVIVLGEDRDKEFDNEKESKLYDMMYIASQDGILENKEFEKWCKNSYEKILGWFDDILREQRDTLAADGLLTKENSYKYVATQELKDEAIKLAGLRKYLLDYTLIKEREAIEVELFESYLIFAQIFGIAEKVAKQFKELYPDLIEQTNFNSYDSLIYINYCTTRGITSANAARAAAESYSSGGGGFSSGGGGGGSFGGGGGGGGFR